MARDRQPVLVRVPVVDAPDRPWSATAVEQFLSCPLRYWWQRLERWETPSTQALVVGRAVHAALEHLLALDPDDRTPARAEEFLAVAIQDEMQLVAGQPIVEEDVAQASAEAMASYFRIERPAQVEVADDGLERQVDADLRGLPFIGHIDRIAYSDPGLRVTDYKTGAPKPKYWWHYWRQQLLYAVALAELGDPIAEVELMYLKDARKVTRPVYGAATSRALDDLEKAHEQRATMASGGAWEARPGPLCSYCDFRLGCPAYRSDVPSPGTPGNNEILLRAGLTQRVAETAAAPVDLPEAEPFDIFADEDLA